jgi:hypothetical protein
MSLPRPIRTYNFQADLLWWGLFAHTTFRQIYSGETVPLSENATKKWKNFFTFLLWQVAEKFFF